MSRGVSNLDRARQLFAAGQRPQAIEYARRAATQSPNDPETLKFLADLLSLTGQGDQASYYYERGAKAAPNHAALRNNFGWHLFGQGKADRAATELEGAIRADPNYVGAWRNLILVYLGSRRMGRAIELGRQAIGRFPDDDVIARNLSIGLIGSGSADEAVRVLREIRARGLVSLPAQTLLTLATNYWDEGTPEEVFAEHRRLGQLFSSAFPKDAPAHANERDPERPLRIGYLSPAFCNHSAGHFIEPILANHDRRHYQVFCYASNRENDEMTMEMRRHAAGWADVAGWPPKPLADKIRADRIDIAVDLTGHTSDSLLGALCLRPAPVQVTYLGYPNTTALPAIEYRLIDAKTDPPGSEALATETLVRLSPCFLCYAPPPHAPDAAAAPPSAASGVVTFGSFNANPKLSGATLDLWAKVLQAVPGSRLILKNQDLADPSNVERRRRQFADRSVAPERVDLLGEMPSKADHLRAYERVDICLDPFPYNGTTTTVEAMWMGVPVVTLAGRSHVSRVGVSLLSVAGLDDLIADTPEDYVRIAAALAADPARLVDLRRSLRERVRTSVLCDGPRFVRGLEENYRQMWHAWCGARR